MSSLMACILLLVWLRQTSRIVLYLVHVMFARIRRITLPQISFTATCLGPVSCPAIITGPSTEKDGVIIEDNEKEKDDDKDEEEAPDEPTGNLGRTIVNAQRDCESEK
jgi:hypothetical protein